MPAASGCPSIRRVARRGALRGRCLASPSSSSQNTVWHAAAIMRALSTLMGGRSAAPAPRAVTGVRRTAYLSDSRGTARGSGPRAVARCRRRRGRAARSPLHLGGGAHLREHRTGRRVVVGVELVDVELDSARRAGSRGRRRRRPGRLTQRRRSEFELDLRGVVAGRVVLGRGDGLERAPVGERVAAARPRGSSGVKPIGSAPRRPGR